MIGGTSGLELIEFVVYAIATGTASGLFLLVWRAGHTRGKLEAELACCQAKLPPDIDPTEPSYAGSVAPFPIDDTFIVGHERGNE